MKLLLAEDEKELSRALTAILKHAGYEVDPVYDGEEALLHILENVYDGLILDIMMPKRDGISVLKEARAKDIATPALFLTAKAEVDDRVIGLDAGADDYLTKPFAMQELLARVRSITRRQQTAVPQQLCVGSVTLDTESLELSSDNSVRLSNRESELMRLFMRNPGKELETDYIFEHLWTQDKETDQDVVWVYVSFLRKKLESIAADIEITGNRGGSYQLVKKQP